jgi:Lipopolysaccharide kinase (Kdo/WaaP) family
VTQSASTISHSTIERRTFCRVAYLNPSLPEDLAAALWNDPSILLGQGEQLRVRGTRRTSRIAWKAQHYVVKHYVEPTFRHTLKQTIQPARARLTWDFAHRLADFGVATPRPVACIENRLGPFRRDSYLMYPYVEGRTLRSYFAVEAKQSPTLHDRLWEQVKELWQRIVELRVSLSDSNLNNFIVAPTGQLWLIDLDKSRFHRYARFAARRQARAWQQLLRSASKC